MNCFEVDRAGMLPGEARLETVSLEPKGRVADTHVAESAPWTWPRVAAVRKRLRWIVLVRGFLISTLACVLPAALALLADWWFSFPRGVRALELLVGLAWMGVVIWKCWWVPWRAIPDRVALALYVERGAPSLRSRLVSAAQFEGVSLGPEADSYLDRLRADARAVSETLDPKTLAPSDGLRTLAWQGGPLLVALAVWLAWAWPTSGILVRRMFLDEVAVPRKTRLLQVTGHLTVGRGDEVALEALAEGVIPAAGSLEVQHASGRVQALPMDRDPARASRFQRVLTGVTSTFRYKVRINDAESAEYTVDVLPRPVLTNLSLVQVWPEYTGRTNTGKRPGELVLLKGSRLRIEGVANSPLRQAKVRLGGVERLVEATLPADSPDRIRAEIPIDDLRMDSFSVELVDSRGIPSRDPAVYAMDVTPDRPPQVRIVLPARREELATRRGIVLIAFEAADDVGLGAVRLRYQPVGDTNGAPASLETALEPDAGPVVKRRFDWSLATMRPAVAEGALIEFWIEATDRNSLDGPGVGRSEKYLLRVVTEAEKRADLLARAGDAIGRLGDVAQGQDRLNESLGRIIMVRPSSP